MYTYTWYQWLTFFYLYCFLGWIFESSYVSILQRRPVNRGFLRIPLLPLYGSGAVMMLWVSLPFQDNLTLTYLSGVVGATALEYLTGLAMESLFKIRYWDYSHKKYNVHGYICLESSLFWGVLTILMTHIVHRPIARAVLAIPAGQDILFVTAVSAVFLYDTIVCTREALALGRSLEAMERFRRELENLQVQTSLLKMEGGRQRKAGNTERQAGFPAGHEPGRALEVGWDPAGNLPGYERRRTAGKVCRQAEASKGPHRNYRQTDPLYKKPLPLQPHRRLQTVRQGAGGFTGAV